MSTSICRICEHEVPIRVLKDHSYKCKAYHDKRDILINLNNRILRKIELVSSHKNELTKDIRLLLKSHNTQEKFHKMDDMLRKIRLLKKIVQYGDRVSRIGGPDYDNRLERGLLTDLERKHEDLQSGRTVRLISRFQELLSKKILLKLELLKLEKELILIEEYEETVNLTSQNTNVVSPKAKKRTFKKNSLKLQIRSPCKAQTNYDKEHHFSPTILKNLESEISKPLELPLINKSRRLLHINSAELNSSNSPHTPRLSGCFSNSPQLNKSPGSGILMSPLGRSPKEQTSPILPKITCQKTSIFANSNSESTLNPETKRTILSSNSRDHLSPLEVTRQTKLVSINQPNRAKDLVKKDTFKSTHQSSLYKDILKKGLSTLEYTDFSHESPESNNSSLKFDKMSSNSERKPSSELPRSKSPEKEEEELFPLKFNKIFSEEHITLPEEDESRPRTFTAPKYLRRPSRLESGLVFSKSRFSIGAKARVFAEDSELQKDAEADSKNEELRTRHDLSLKKEDFNRGDLSTLNSQERVSNEVLEYLGSPTLKGYFSDTAHHSLNWRPEKFNKTSIEDFQFIKMISKGAYGKVWLVKHKLTGDIYAMKLINSSEKMNANRMASLNAEKNVFERLEGDYVVKAVYAFTHGDYICFVMEYMIGGDFGSILEKHSFLEEQCARFYIGELILAIESLHKIGIVHRDLKPDNILLDAKGHVKLADFGLSEIGLDLKRQKSAIPAAVLKNSQPGTPERNPRSPGEIGTPNRSIGASRDVNLSHFSRKSIILSPVKMKNSQEMLFSQPKTPDSSSISKGFSKVAGALKNENLSHFAKSPTNLSPTLIKSSQENFKSSLSSQYSKHSQTRIMPKSPLKGDATPHKQIRIIGTPDYMAPEIILGLSNTDKSIDWWAVGVILYEFLVGIPPFNDETVNAVFDNIINLRIEWPKTEEGSEYLTPEAKNLITGLLTKDPRTRLGSQGVEEIKNHPFFKDFDWENVREREAPLKSIVKNETDTSNFYKGSQIITEEEKQNPFSTPKITGNREAFKNQIDLKKFQMKRRDLLLQLNIKDYEKYISQESYKMSTNLGKDINSII